MKVSVAEHLFIFMLLFFKKKISKISVMVLTPEGSVACYEYCIRAESIAADKEGEPKAQPALHGNRTEMDISEIH